MRYLLSVLIIVILFFEQSFAQEFLDVMVLEETNATSIIVQNPNESLLEVKAPIDEIRIESNNKIINITKVKKGIWWVYLKPGTHIISFQAEGLTTVQKRFFFNPKDVKGVQIKIEVGGSRRLNQNSGQLIISTDPEGADIYINEEFYGRTPYQGNLLSGKYKLEIKKDSYLTIEKNIIIRPAALNPWNFSLSAISCEQYFKEAEKKYYNAEFNEALVLLNQYLIVCNPDMTMQKQTYRLMILTYMAKNDRKMAGDIVIKLLKVNRGYTADIIKDKPAYIRLVNEVRKEIATKDEQQRIKQKQEQQEEQLAIKEHPEEESNSTVYWIVGSVVAAGVVTFLLMPNGGSDNAEKTLPGHPDFPATGK